MYTQPSLPSPSPQELFEAAVIGDVVFLKRSASLNLPNEFYLTILKPQDYNIFHLAMNNNSVEFIREVITMLPPNIIQTLILNQCKQNKFNPLHIAASNGRLEILKLFLDAFRYTSLPLQQPKPWLQLCSMGNTPCHIAILRNQEDCALELLEMDAELISLMTHHVSGFGILYIALERRFNRLALQILRSPYSFSTLGPNGSTPLHIATRCAEGEDICTLLLQRAPQLMKQTDGYGFSVLHYWAREGNLWPFECALKISDTIPDVRNVFVDLISQVNKNGLTPLHTLAEHSPSANDENLVKIAKLLIDTYNQEAAAHIYQKEKEKEKVEAHASSSSISEDLLPWIAQTSMGDTPLNVAVNYQNEKLAIFLLSMCNYALRKSPKNALFLAIENECFAVADLILEIVENQGWTELLTKDKMENVLHLAPLCTEGFCKRLLEKHPMLLEGVDENGRTILHSWVLHGKVWLFELVFESIEIDHKWKSYLANQVVYTDYKSNNPFHVAAKSNHGETDQIVKLLVEAFKQQNSGWSSSSIQLLPWFQMNKAYEVPLHLAIRNRRQRLALTFLSLYEAPFIDGLLDYYMPEHSTLFLAMENECYEVAKELLIRLDDKNWIKYAMNTNDGRNVLHLAPSCTDETFGRWLVREMPNDIILEPDQSGITPLVEAFNDGAAWCIEEMLKKDPSVYSKAPLAWIKACENGHVSAIRVFIDGCPEKIKDYCLKHKDSPLHHILLPNLKEYEEFLKIPQMKDIINVQDSEGATPLHKAVRSQNIQLAKILLNTDMIMDDIADHKNETAKGLLVEACKQHNWADTCKSIGYDPTIKTSYFPRMTDQLGARNTLFVVAALLTTITFTAGFTLPGGFNQDTGEAILARKAAFLVFLISDTLAMCSSMLVLICLVWSIVSDPNKSLVLIDRSMTFLMLALYSTLLAFMTGVFAVISQKSLWAAILIIAMCSLIFISANRDLLYTVLNNLIPTTSASTKHGNCFSLWNRGKYVHVEEAAAVRNASDTTIINVYDDE